MRKLKRLLFIRSKDEFLIRANDDLVLFISKLLRHYWSGPWTSVAFTFRLRLIFRLSTNEDGKSTSKSCCKQPKLILFFWIRSLTVVVKKSKNWNHWRINLFGIKKACFFCTYHNPNFLYKMMQHSSHFQLINFGSVNTWQVQFVTYSISNVTNMISKVSFMASIL